MKLRDYTRIIVTVSSLVILSCNRYIDQVKADGEAVRHDQFTFYSDSNLLFYKSSVALQADNDTYYPKSFQVALPKKLKSYKFMNSEEFSFFYDGGQVLFIKINLRNSVNERDTTYTPSENEVSAYIENKLYSSPGKYDITKIAVKPNRKQTFIKKGPATILLYNVLPENHDFFLKAGNSFRIIKND